MTTTDTHTPRDEAKVAELLSELGDLQARITEADTTLRGLWAARVAAYRRGVDLGISKAEMGRAAGTTGEAVLHALKRGS